MEDYANGPDVRFAGVLVLPVGLGAHVGWGTHIVGDLGFLLPLELAEPKISDLRMSLRQEDVGGFQIPMDYPLFLYGRVPL